MAAVRRIAIAKRGVTPKLTRVRYLAAVKRARPPQAFRRDWQRGSLEGFLFPALYEFTQFTNGNELVAVSARRLPEGVRGREPLVCPVEEPDAVRRAQDRLHGREGDRGSPRAEARRRGHLQPSSPGDAPRDRRDDPLRARHPRHPLPHEGRACEQLPVQQPSLPGTAADADRESRHRLDQGGCSSGSGRLSLLRPHPRDETALLHGERDASSCGRCASSATPAIDPPPGDTPGMPSCEPDPGPIVP